jgi:hypothetical protein
MPPVPEYDAFGREIGEDTLAGLGGDSRARARPAPEQEPEPEPRDADPPPRDPAPTFTVQRPSMPRRRSGAGVGCLIGLVILAVVVVGPVIALVGFVDDAGDTIDEITDTIDGIAPDTDRVAPVGVTGASMVSRANFAQALVSAQLVKGSRQRNAQIDFEGDFERGALTRGAPVATALALKAIDPGAPARLVRGSRRFGTRPKGIDYLVLSPSAGAGARWVAYFKNGVYVEGDLRGKVVRRIS